MKKTLAYLLLLLLCSSPILATDEDSWESERYRKNNYIQELWAKTFLDDVPLTTATEILDLGCGDGKLTRQLAEKSPHAKVHGIDLSRNMIEAAHKLIDNEIKNRLSWTSSSRANCKC